MKDLTPIPRDYKIRMVTMFLKFAMIISTALIASKQCINYVSKDFTDLTE